MNFEIGQVVTLQSDAPQMTVEGFGDLVNGSQMVKCVWFDGHSNLCRDTFPAATLKVA
jgi:uncharacterized protein YodC (DUF2158 family)